MAWLYIYRLLVPCAQSKAAGNSLVKSTTLVVYSSMGIATGVLTLVTVPIMFVRGNITRGLFSSTVLFELFRTSVLWILWFVTGGLVFSDPNVAQFKKDWQPIAALSVVTVVVLLIYTLTLLFVAVRRAMNRQPIRNATVMDSEKPVLGATTATA
ncbi:hypothetical protein LXA43DRAFT_1064439 [Ganoderma leucocontextum]|nr:hypothetical protein LXA43DRAFT_1064439 [Ganoderma leucocontextum]